jgi:hypothetical protein
MHLILKPINTVNLIAAQETATDGKPVDEFSTTSKRNIRSVFHQSNASTNVSKTSLRVLTAVDPLILRRGTDWNSNGELKGQRRRSDKKSPKRVHGLDGCPSPRLARLTRRRNRR